MARFGMAAAALALMAAPLFAQESTEQLKKELEQLRAEVDGLKAVNQTKEIPASGGAQVDALSPDDSPLMTMFKSTKLSGFVDMSYNYSLRGTGAGLTSVYGARVFDNQANIFALQAIQLNLERLATKDMIVGYHVELAAGVDPTVYTGASFALGFPASGTFGNIVTIQEAWLEILAPIGNGLDIKVGRMATIAGYEVIESMNDMNFSRGLLFGFAIPFTHTGVRANYSFAEQFNVTVGLNNGWNNAFEFDNSKTVELQVEIKPMKDLKMAATMYWGNEPAAQGANPNFKNSPRTLLDFVVEYKMDKLTAAFEFDWGVQERGGLVANPAWGGMAIFLKYQLSDMFAPSARVEYFSEGFGRTVTEASGAGFPSSGITGALSRTIEFTLTGEFKIANTLILRAEFRHDDNNVPGAFAFPGGRGQDQISMEAIMPF